VRREALLAKRNSIRCTVSKSRINANETADNKMKHHVMVIMTYKRKQTKDSRETA
jgi:hypothetical protein